ncbi:MAG: Flp family type IVb pilin [Pseudobdellovibrionaceae bacterium]
MKSASQPIQNQKGQTLIEYLIIVALVGVGSIALMRAVSQNVNTSFAKVVRALGGDVDGKPEAQKVSSSMYRKRDMKDFANHTSDGDKKNDSSSSE